MEESNLPDIEFNVMVIRVQHHEKNRNHEKKNRQK